MTAPFLGWYGDDFTGAAAEMEMLEFAGYPSVQFVDPPGVAAWARFPGRFGEGIADDAQRRGPGRWKDRRPADQEPVANPVAASPVEISAEARARLAAATGAQCIDLATALHDAEVVVLAVPDRVLAPDAVLQSVKDICTMG